MKIDREPGGGRHQGENREPRDHDSHHRPVRNLYADPRKDIPPPDGPPPKSLNLPSRSRLLGNGEGRAQRGGPRPQNIGGRRNVTKHPMPWLSSMEDGLKRCCSRLVNFRLTSWIVISPRVCKPQASATPTLEWDGGGLVQRDFQTRSPDASISRRVLRWWRPYRCLYEWRTDVGRGGRRAGWGTKPWL